MIVCVVVWLLCVIGQTRTRDRPGTTGLIQLVRAPKEISRGYSRATGSRLGSNHRALFNFFLLGPNNFALLCSPFILATHQRENAVTSVGRYFAFLGIKTPRSLDTTVQYSKRILGLDYSELYQTLETMT